MTRPSSPTAVSVNNSTVNVVGRDQINPIKNIITILSQVSEAFVH
jgi:hypothetical protein